MNRPSIASTHITFVSSWSTSPFSTRNGEEGDRISRLPVRFKRMFSFTGNIPGGTVMVNINAQKSNAITIKSLIGNESRLVSCQPSIILNRAGMIITPKVTQS